MDSGTCVCVRMRPPNAREGGTRCLGRVGDAALSFVAEGSGAGAAGASEFRFSKVYGARCGARKGPVPRAMQANCRMGRVTRICMRGRTCRRRGLEPAGRVQRLPRCGRGRARGRQWNNHGVRPDGQRQDAHAYSAGAACAHVQASGAVRCGAAATRAPEREGARPLPRSLRTLPCCCPCCPLPPTTPWGPSLGRPHHQGDVTKPLLRGIVPRAVEALGEGIAADSSGAEYEVGRQRRAGRSPRKHCRAALAHSHTAAACCWLRTYASHTCTRRCA